MRFEEAERRLIAARNRELPGPSAQAIMAPRPRRYWVPGEVPVDARAAAGLALLFPRGTDTALLLTVRGSQVATHRGQVSLPGGAVEAGESIEAAAIREADEEVGLARDVPVPRVRLTPLHIPVSGYVLHPVVATAVTPPAVRPCEPEVGRIVEVGLAALSSGELLRFETIERDGFAMVVPYFEVAGEKLWGATAMVVAELLAVLEIPLDPWAGRT